MALIVIVAVEVTGLFVGRPSASTALDTVAVFATAAPAAIASNVTVIVFVMLGLIGPMLFQVSVPPALSMTLGMTLAETNRNLVGSNVSVSGTTASVLSASNVPVEVETIGPWT